MGDRLQELKELIDKSKTKAPGNVNYHDVMLLISIVTETKIWLIPEYEKLEKRTNKQPQLCYKDDVYECFCYDIRALPYCANFYPPNGPPYAYHCKLKEEFTWETCPYGKLWEGDGNKYKITGDRDDQR